MRIDGETLGRSEHLLALTLVSRLDHIASARLVYQDGSASAGGFALSSSDLLVPGKTISISAGPAHASEPLFSGVIVRHSLKLRDRSAPQLIIEARHGAVVMSVERNSRVFTDQTDADVIETLFADAGVDAEVYATEVSHRQLVQYQCSDWHFCLARARLNARHLMTRSDGIRVAAIEAAGEARADLVFGATLLEADLRLDARTQFAGSSALAWDAASQALDEQEAADPGLDQPGNLGPAALAEVVGLDKTRRRHPQLAADEALQWAAAVWTQASANRVQGRVKCEGIGTVQVGDLVNLDGVGERFNGLAFVTGVRHQFDTLQGWKTHLQFGGIEPLEDLVPAMSAPPAAALLPAIGGLHIGVVVSNDDPDGEFRVRVRLPLIDSDDEGTWARVACLDAGAERGTFFRPEVDDEVVLGFLNDDPRAPVVLGMLNSSARPAPLAGSDDNHEKVIQTRSGLQWHINDDTVAMTLQTPAGNRLLLSDDQQAIVLEDQHGNSITLDADGIHLDSSQAITLAAATDLEATPGAALKVAAGSELKLEGGASAELSSAGQTVIKGGIVQIN